MKFDRFMLFLVEFLRFSTSRLNYIRDLFISRVLSLFHSLSVLSIIKNSVKLLLLCVSFSKTIPLEWKRDGARRWWGEWKIKRLYNEMNLLASSCSIRFPIAVVVVVIWHRKNVYIHNINVVIKSSWTWNWKRNF